MTEEDIAKGLLLKLLKAGNRKAAGVRQRAPALTASQLTAYSALRNWHQKLQCEELFLAARDAGAISFTRDKLNPADGLIERIELLDTGILAGLLKQTTHADIMAQTRSLLEPYLARHDVLEEVIEKWARLTNVRGSGPTDVNDWIEAMTVIEQCDRAQTQTLSSVRETSARLLRNSKRIEQLTVPLDVLLQGSIETTARTPAEVWQELGLFKEDQPVMFAGNVEIVRGRVTALLDEPYTGLPAGTVQAISGVVAGILTIENLTTFHTEAKRHANEPKLLIYTAGMPSPAWREMYQRLLTGVAPGTPIHHWGDVDEGGFRIASKLAQTSAAAGHELKPHFMSPEDVPEELRKPASNRTLNRMKHFAESAGWPALGEALLKAGFTVEQEAL
ncbi:Wadjet anti-phage system protein JetD domain-containing protein [Pseudomonas sp. NPDC088444]|uniref:Wadjet anti-phage system protein JetD domain-containing protein n=1 Tax=Pseudomonas sp. NPDC088444 TaxID=3364456 RepID=UPI00384E81AE